MAKTGETTAKLDLEQVRRRGGYDTQMLTLVRYRAWEEKRARRDIQTRVTVAAQFFFNTQFSSH